VFRERLRHFLAIAAERAHFVGMFVVVCECSMDLPERPIELIGHVARGVLAGREVVHGGAGPCARNPGLPADTSPVDTISDIYSSSPEIKINVGGGDADHPVRVSLYAPTNQETYAGAAGRSDMRILVTGGAGFIGGTSRRRSSATVTT